MDGAITRAEHEEFCRRIDEENRRQNRRIELLEEGEQRIATLTASVERLATSMESMLKEQERQGKRLETLESRDGEMWRKVSMLKEQERQGKRLETLESRDGEMWRKVVGHVVTFTVGAVLAFLFAQVGM